MMFFSAQGIVALRAAAESDDLINQMLTHQKENVLNNSHYTVHI